MHQLERRGRRAGLLQLIAHEILDRLDVVLDARFVFLDRGRGLRARIIRERRGARRDSRRQRRAGELWNGLCELEQPEGLDADSLANQAGLAEHRAERVSRCSVSPINGRKGRQAGLVHAAVNARG